MYRNLNLSKLRRDLLTMVVASSACLAYGSVFALDEAAFGHRILADNYSNQSAGVGVGLTRIVFYRPVDSSVNNAATIYVNNMYHASLVSGGYTEICLVPGMARLGVREMKVEQGPKDGQDSEFRMDAKAGTTQYIRVREDDGTLWSLESVPARQAERELIETKLQVHTVSRVVGAKKCEGSNPGRIELVGDDLFGFKFARSDRGGLTGRGIDALNNVIDTLDRDYSSLDQVTVVGYADPLGETYRNQQISEERAQTILTYLQANGLQAASFRAEGRGSQDLVVTTCPDFVSPQSIACNQPNRRVVIEVSGQHR